MDNNKRSVSLFERATAVIPGGVNSAVRSFGSVGGMPLAIESAGGSRMFTVDGEELLDFCCSWGPLILGHAHPKVIEAVQEAASAGLSFGTVTRREIEFAEFLCENISNAEMVRTVNSGTEATMTACRLARGATGRNKILKFEGCYHGHADHLLTAGGSGLLQQAAAASAGVPNGITEDVLVAPYNDIGAVKEVSREFGDQLAAIIVEPIAGNMGFVEPDPDFLQGLRKYTDQCGAVLIFDEVITGFRFGPTTFGDICGTAPDLTCLGKIIGGGMPIGALAGRNEIMRHLVPCGSVYQAGTLSGNPVAMAAGLATLRQLATENPYPYLAGLGERLRHGMNETVAEKFLPIHCAGKGSLFTPFFTEQPVTDLASAKTADTNSYARFFHNMLAQDIYLPPSQFELGFISTAHTEVDIERFLESVSNAI